MKELLILGAVILLMSFKSYSQSLTKDPSFSNSNYKHQNEVVEAGKKGDDKVEISSGKEGTNYKAQNSVYKETAPLVIYPVNLEVKQNFTRNYKQQFNPNIKDSKKEGDDENVFSAGKYKN